MMRRIQRAVIKWGLIIGVGLFLLSMVPSCAAGIPAPWSDDTDGAAPQATPAAPVTRQSAVSPQQSGTPASKPAPIAAPVTQTPCDSEVRWRLPFLSDTPVGAPQSIQWAYLQVADVTGVTAYPVDEDETVAFNWDEGHTVTGSYPDKVGPLSTETTWMHHYRFGPPRDVVREQVFHDVLADLGVTNPTSTTDGLSARDKRQLKAICAAQRAVTAPVEEPLEPWEEEAIARGYTDETPAGDTTPVAQPEPTDTASAGASLPGGKAGLWIILFLLIPLFAYAVAGEKFLALVKWLKSLKRRKGDDTTEGHVEVSQ